MKTVKAVNQTITIIRVAIYAIAILGIGAWAWKNFAQPSPTTTPPSQKEKSTSPHYTDNTSNHVVVVTYFTSNVRCKTCLKIEKLTTETLHQNFAQEMANKEVVFQTIIFDQPENKHFVKDYQLSFKTVVVSERKKGKELRFSKYDRVWQLHGDPDAFSDYLSKGIRQYLTPTS